MKGILSRALSLVRRGWKTLFLFEILFRLFSAFAVFPACQWLFNACLRWTGLNYLTAENAGQFLADPRMLACSAAILVAFALTTTIEITGLITCLHAAARNDTPTIFQLIREGLRDAGRILRPKNLPLLLFMAFLVPIAQAADERQPAAADPPAVARAGGIRAEFPLHPRRRCLSGGRNGGGRFGDVRLSLLRARKPRRAAGRAQRAPDEPRHPLARAVRAAAVDRGGLLRRVRRHGAPLRGA